MRFDNQVVLITGGASGIGKATAEMFLAKGARLAVVDINEKALLAFSEEKKEQANNIATFKCDVSASNDVDETVSKIIEKCGQIDVLVNSHGIYQPTLTRDMTDEHWDKTIRTNLYGVFYLCRRVSKEMTTRRYGKIINIASVAGQRGSIANGHYSASKRGIEGFTKSLALELVEYNISVNCIAPGIIDTPMVEFEDVNEEMKNQRIAAWKNAIPMKRFGEAKELAGAILFLASEYASYITGLTIDVNGGMYLR